MILSLLISSVSMQRLQLPVRFFFFFFPSGICNVFLPIYSHFFLGESLSELS